MKPSARDTYHWLAGVCDASLKVRGRIRDEMLQTMSMYACVSPTVGSRLVQLFGGTYHEGTWRVDPARQQQFAMTVMDFVHDPVLCEKLRTVVRFRITRFKMEGFTNAVPESVKLLRRKLAREFTRLRSYEKSLATGTALRDTIRTSDAMTE